MNFRLFHPRQFLRCCIVVLAFGGTVKAEDLLDAPGPGYFRQQEDAIRQLQMHRELSPALRTQMLELMRQPLGGRPAQAEILWLLQTLRFPGRSTAERTRILDQIRRLHGTDIFKEAPPALPEIPSPLPTLPVTNPFEGPVHLFGHPQ